MQARAEELIRSFSNLPPRVLNFLTFCASLLLCLGIVVFVVWCRAMIAPVYHSDEPCDRPGLKYYAFASFGFSIGSRQISQALTRSMQPQLRSLQRLIALKLLVAIPGWCLLVWGCYMVTVSKTCAETDPGLYYPTKYYILVQAFVCIILLILSIVCSLGARYFILPLSRLFEGAGCKEAVMKLPKIPSDSDELIDPEDGGVMSCPICIQSLGDGAEVVRCPCTHYFHTECLASWCRNHLDCPMCRAPIGEPDEQV